MITVILPGEHWNLRLVQASRTPSDKVENQENLPFPPLSEDLKVIQYLLNIFHVLRLFLKEINPEYSLEGLMLKLKLQYSGHLM